MEKAYKDKKKYWKSFMLVMATVLLFALIVGAVISIIRDYENAILQSQRDQLSNITQSVSNNMEIYMEDLQSETEYLVQMQSFEKAEEQCLAGNEEELLHFLDEIRLGREQEVVFARYYSPDGEDRVQAGEVRDYEQKLDLGSNSTFHHIDILKDEEGIYYFGISSQSERGGSLQIVVPASVIYDRTASYIQMGEKGYVMVKDSSGIILMHPVEAQRGIDVLADRKKLHPDFDFSELEVLIQHQLEGRTDVETYHSYWWADDEPQRTRKVAAYRPLYLGEDFICISAVIDYSEIADPVQAAAVRMAVVTAIIVFVISIILILLLHSMSRKRKVEAENSYLREVNEKLEKLREQEEIMAHEQRLQLIGTMTGGIAHEFNNLLTPIMGYSAMILEDMDPEDDNYEDMKEILDSAEKAKEIIDQITRFSGKNAERMHQPMHVGEALKKALIIADAVKPRRIQLVTEIQQDNDVCLGNPLQIHQMIINLCNNAIHAMGEGKGTLTVQGKVVQPQDKKNRFFRGREKQWFYEISIQDTGCGMTKETADQIFIPFFTTKKPGEGTGLGLAIVHRMVEAHQGIICVHSKLGEGTTFIIYLPLLENQEEQVVDI